MQHAGHHQYGQGAANSHQSPPFVHEDLSSGGGNATSTLRQFRKKELPVDGKPQVNGGGGGGTTGDQIQESSHIARVAPHNYHHPATARSNDYATGYPRYPHQYADYSGPYKDSAHPPPHPPHHHQVKYSEIAESSQNLPQKDNKDFMEMCNITQQQAHIKQPYSDNLARQQVYSDTVHHQYLHKEPPQVHPAYKSESHQYQQYQHQLAKYGMPPSGAAGQCRKFAPPPPPPENDFLAKLQRINPIMARSIMSDHHVLEAQSNYPKLPGQPSEQNRMYHQSQHQRPYAYNPQSNNYNYAPIVPQHHHNHPQIYNYGSYGRVGPPPTGTTMRYPSGVPGNERPLSPRRYDNVIGYNQKMPAGYNQYQYAQHYQHRRDGNASAIPIQEYYQQQGCHGRAAQYLNQVPSTSSSPEPREGEGGRVNSASSAIRHYLETWAEEEAPGEIGVDGGGQVFVINSDLSPEGLENLSVISNEHGQFVLQNGDGGQGNKDVNASEPIVEQTKADDQSDWSDCQQLDGACGGDNSDSSKVPSAGPSTSTVSNVGVDSEKVESGGCEGGDDFRDPNRTPSPGDDGNRIAGTQKKVETTVRTEDGKVVTKTMEVEETQIDEDRASFGFKVTKEVEVDEDDFLTKDMPVIDESNICKEPISTVSTEELPSSEVKIDEPEKSVDSDHEAVDEVVTVAKRSQRIFSVDDIINNIGNTSTNHSRRNSLQLTKDFAISNHDCIDEHQPKIVPEPSVVEEPQPLPTEEEDGKVDDQPQEDEEVRNAISIDVDNVIIEMAGVFFQLSVNVLNGNKVLSVLPLSDSLIVDVNGNYASGESVEETKDKDSEKVVEEVEASTTIVEPIAIDDYRQEVESTDNVDDAGEVTSTPVDDVVFNEVTLGDDLPQEETIPLEESILPPAPPSEELLEVPNEEIETVDQNPIPEEVDVQKDIPEVVDETLKPDEDKNNNVPPEVAEDVPEIDLDLPQLADDDNDSTKVITLPKPRKLRRKSYQKSPRKSLDEPIVVKKPDEVTSSSNHKEIILDVKPTKKDDVEVSCNKTRSFSSKKHQIIDLSGKSNKTCDVGNTLKKKDLGENEKSPKSVSNSGSKVKIEKSPSKTKVPLVDLKPKLVLKKIDDPTPVKCTPKVKKIEEIKIGKTIDVSKSPSSKKDDKLEEKKKKSSPSGIKVENLSKFGSRRSSDSSIKMASPSTPVLPTIPPTNPTEERVLFTKAAKKLFPQDSVISSPSPKKSKIAEQPPVPTIANRHGNNNNNKNKSKRKLEDALNKIKSLKEKQNEAKIKKLIVAAPINNNNNEEEAKMSSSLPSQPAQTSVVVPQELPKSIVEKVKKSRIPKKVTFESQSQSEENKKKLSWEEYSSRKRKHPSFSEDSPPPSTPTTVNNKEKEDALPSIPITTKQTSEEVDVLEKVVMSIENEIISKKLKVIPSPPPPPTPRPVTRVILNAKNDWEDDDDYSDVTATKIVTTATPSTSSLSNVKPIIDVNDFNIKPIEATSPHFSEDDSLQVYKEVVDLKLNSLSIQIPRQSCKPKSPESATTNVGLLIRRFLTKGATLSHDELEKMRKIIEYKRLLEGDRKGSSLYEVDRNDIKLHFRKVTSSSTSLTETSSWSPPPPASGSRLVHTKGGKKKRKRFRNLYADDSSSANDDHHHNDDVGYCHGDDVDSDSSNVNNISGNNVSSSRSTKLCDYSVYQQNNNSSHAGVPKLIIKRKSGLLQPFVKLERSQAVDMMAKKRKF